MARSRAESLAQTGSGAAEAQAMVAERGEAVVERSQAEIEQSFSQAADVQPIAPTTPDPPTPPTPQLTQEHGVEVLSISQLPPRKDAHCSEDVDASLSGMLSSPAAHAARIPGHRAVKACHTSQATSQRCNSHSSTIRPCSEACALPEKIRLATVWHLSTSTVPCLASHAAPQQNLRHATKACLQMHRSSQHAHLMPRPGTGTFLCAMPPCLAQDGALAATASCLMLTSTFSEAAPASPGISNLWPSCAITRTS